MTGYCIEVMKGPVYTYYVNGKQAGTTVASVQRIVQGPTRQQVAKACALAKDDGKAVSFHASPLGWVAYR